MADGLERRREPLDRTKAIPYAQLDRLWRRDDVAVREKGYGGCYMRPPRAQEVLSLNVEDVELENKRARVRSKGGDIEWLHCTYSPAIASQMLDGGVQIERGTRLL